MKMYVLDLLGRCKASIRSREWQVIDCTACGRYFISRQFMQENVGKTLDVEATRQLIVDAIRAGVIPAVSEGTARFTVARKHPK